MPQLQTQLTTMTNTSSQCIPPGQPCPEYPKCRSPNQSPPVFGMNPRLWDHTYNANGNCRYFGAHRAREISSAPHIRLFPLACRLIATYDHVAQLTLPRSDFESVVWSVHSFPLLPRPQPPICTRSSWICRQTLRAARSAREKPASSHSHARSSRRRQNLRHARRWCKKISAEKSGKKLLLSCHKKQEQKFPRKNV